MGQYLQYRGQHLQYMVQYTGMYMGQYTGQYLQYMGQYRIRPSNLIYFSTVDFAQGLACGITNRAVQHGDSAGSASKSANNTIIMCLHDDSMEALSCMRPPT